MKHDYNDQLTFLLGLGDNFFSVYLSVHFFLCFHFPDLTCLKLFLSHYNCLFLPSVILFQRVEMR